LEHGEPVDGLLRRKTVSAKTRQLYTTVATDFLVAHQLHEHSDPIELDRALDADLVRLYLAGESPVETNYLYYAVRWMCCRTNADLRLSFRSRQGHSKVARSRHVEPETWEGVLLMCRALLLETQDTRDAEEAARAACGFLLSFDTYARGFDLVGAETTELRAPLGAAARSAANAWTLTLFPATGRTESKTHRQDLTKIVGGTDPRRAWLSRLCPALKASRMGQHLLLGIDESRYQYLFHRARRLAKVPDSHPHRLRHGGASADGLLDEVTDLQIQERGNWASIKSVALYRQPARYLRQLERLTAAQRALAAVSPPLVEQLILAQLRRRPSRTRRS